MRASTRRIGRFLGLRGLLLSLAILVLAGACRQAEDTRLLAEPTVTPAPDPRQLLEQAGAAMQALESVRWSMTRTGGPAFLDDAGTLNLSEARGIFVAPEAIQATIKTLGPGVVFELETVAVGEEQWVTNPLTLAWEKLPPGWGFNPAVLFDPVLGWEPLLREDVTAARFVGLDEFAGLTRYQIEATIEGERVRVLTGGLARDPSLTARVWLDPETLRVTQLRFESTSPTGEPSSWQLTFQDFNADLSINRPEL